MSLRPLDATQLETAATAGVLLVLALIGLLGAEAVRTQFPAIRDGSLPVWSLRVDKNLPSAFSVVGYAFYMQVGAGPEAVRVVMAWQPHIGRGGGVDSLSSRSPAGIPRASCTG
jgi:hypothetical protein